MSLIKLKSIREERNYSQRELAEAIHVSTSTISHYEKGTREPDTTTLIQLSDYLNVSADYLIGRAQSNITPEQMSKPYCMSTTFENLMERLLKLKPVKRKLLVSILECMEAEQFISEKARKK